MKGLTPPLQGKSRGMSLIEVMIALAILGIISVTFLTGISTAYKATIIGGEQTSAESLVRSEMEYVKNSAYNSTGFSYNLPGTPPSWDGNHTALPDQYANYSLNVTGIPIDAESHAPLAAGENQGMQLITIKVYHHGELILTTSTYNYKIKR